MANPKPRDPHELQMCYGGQRGITLITDTAAHSGETWLALTFLSDTVFAALTAPKLDGNTWSGHTFPKGTTIYGNFTVIDLASGSLLAYKG